MAAIYSISITSYGVHTCWNGPVMRGVGPFCLEYWVLCKGSLVLSWVEWVKWLDRVVLCEYNERT